MATDIATASCAVLESEIALVDRVPECVRRQNFTYVMYWEYNNKVKTWLKVTDGSDPDVRALNLQSHIVWIGESISDSTRLTSREIVYDSQTGKAERRDTYRVLDRSPKKRDTIWMKNPAASPTIQNSVNKTEVNELNANKPGTNMWDSPGVKSA